VKNQQQLTLKIISIASHILDEYQYVSTIDIAALSTSLNSNWICIGELDDAQRSVVHFSE
jgi:hypothetical protein